MVVQTRSNSFLTIAGGSTMPGRIGRRRDHQARRGEKRQRRRPRRRPRQRTRRSLRSFWTGRLNGLFIISPKVSVQCSHRWRQSEAYQLPTCSLWNRASAWCIAPWWLGCPKLLRRRIRIRTPHAPLPNFFVIRWWGHAWQGESCHNVLCHLQVHRLQSPAWHIGWRHSRASRYPFV